MMRSMNVMPTPVNMVEAAMISSDLINASASQDMQGQTVKLILMIASTAHVRMEELALTELMTSFVSASLHLMERPVKGKWIHVLETPVSMEVFALLMEIMESFHASVPLATEEIDVRLI